jgi:hypothetical protein
MSGRTKRFLAPVTAFLSISVMLVFFQNCTVATNFKSAQPDPAAKGNGTGYEGAPKDFENVDENSACADGSNVVHNIHRDSNGVFTLDRANCTNLNPPKVLELSDLRLEEVIHEDRSVAIFQGRLFVERRPASPTPQPNGGESIKALCRASSPEVDIQVAVRMNNSPAGGAPFYARAVSFYKNNVNSLVSTLPPGVTGGGVCRAGSYYRSVALGGTFTANPSSSVIFEGSSGSVGSNSWYGYSNYYNYQQTPTGPTRLQILRPLATGSGEIVISTQFFQGLIVPGAADDATMACHSHFSNDDLPSVQGRAFTGRCIFMNVGTPLVH